MARITGDDHRSCVLSQRVAGPIHESMVNDLSMQALSYFLIPEHLGVGQASMICIKRVVKHPFIQLAINNIQTISIELAAFLVKPISMDAL